MLIKKNSVMHKCPIGIAPTELGDLVRPLNSERSRKFEIPISVGKYGDRAFSVAGPKLWNALPHNIREEMITTDFKRKLKTFLFSNSVSFYQRVNMK